MKLSNMLSASGALALYYCERVVADVYRGQASTHIIDNIFNIKYMYLHTRTPYLTRRYLEV